MEGRLLIVDDEEHIRAALMRHFRFLGYDADSAADSLEALTKMAVKEYDVVITDIVMPEINGLDLMREIRRCHPLVRVIVITGFATLDHLNDCVRNRAETCIFKPLSDLRELEQATNAAVTDTRTWKRKLHQPLMPIIPDQPAMEESFEPATQPTCGLPHHVQRFP